LDDGTDIILSPAMIRFMMDAFVQLAQGNAITLLPVHAELSTQQAADLLNVSRPYFVDDLLEKGYIPFRKVGTRRRILFKDVMDYKNRIDKSRLDTLSKMVEHDQQYEQFGYGY
jgi:excisionase family DNA binding protein